MVHALGKDRRDVCFLFVARYHPAVLEFARHSREIRIVRLEYGVEAHHVAERVGDEDVQLEPFPLEDVAERPHVGRVDRTRVLEEREVFTLLEVDAGRRDVAVLVEECRETDLVQPHEGDREKRPYGVAFQREPAARHQIHHAHRGLEFAHLVVDVRIDEIGRPAEILGFDVLGRKADFDAVRFHLGDVALLLDDTADALRCHVADQVEVVTFVPVDYQVDAVVGKAHVGPDVELVFLLVGERRVLEVFDLQSRFAVAGRRPPGGVGVDHHARVGHRRRAAVGSERIGRLQRQVRQRGLCLLEPGLFMQVPCA